MITMTSKDRKLVNRHFYNPFLQKKGGRKSDISNLLGMTEDDIFPLQYDERETKDFIEGARVFKVHYGGKQIKVRHCGNKKEAEEVFSRARYATRYCIAMCEPLEVVENLALFSYVEGRPMHPDEAHEHLDQIASIQAALTRVEQEEHASLFVDQLLTKMVLRCFSRLGEIDVGSRAIEKLKKALDSKPRIVAVFDHQDYGLHNLVVRRDGKVHVVDEEAFGLLPFGYGLVRPMFDRRNYRITADDNMVRYLSFFTKEQREYFMSNVNYFRALFILRNSVRRHLVGNEEGAIKLLTEAEELK